MTGNPVVALNRAVALAMVEGPRAGIKALPTVKKIRERIDFILSQEGIAHDAAGRYHLLRAADTSKPETIPIDSIFYYLNYSFEYSVTFF